MNCRVCSNPINAKNKSPLKGVCKQDFKFLSPAHAAGVEVTRLPKHVQRGEADAMPDNIPLELFEKHIASFGKMTFVQEARLKIELSAAERKQLTQIRLKNVKKIIDPLYVRDESMQRPVPVEVETKSLRVTLSAAEAFQLEQIRGARRFGTQFPLKTKPLSINSWEDMEEYLDWLLEHAASTPCVVCGDNKCREVHEDEGS